jgi:DNA-binding beta-propeller fold protein YncE
VIRSLSSRRIAERDRKRRKVHAASNNQRCRKLLVWLSVPARVCYYADTTTLVVLASSVPTTETAACWVEMSRNGRYAFTTNAGSSSISAFRSGRDGSLTLTTEDGVAASTGAGSAPIDLVLSAHGNYLFSLSAADGTIAAFRLIGNRELVPMPGVTGLPGTVDGLAAY